MALACARPMASIFAASALPSASMAAARPAPSFDHFGAAPDQFISDDEARRLLAVQISSKEVNQPGQHKASRHPHGRADRRARAAKLRHRAQPAEAG